MTKYTIRSDFAFMHHYILNNIAYIFAPFLEKPLPFKSLIQKYS